MSNLWGKVQYYITKFSLGGIFYENIDHNLWFLPNGMFLTPIFIKIKNILWGVPNKCGLQGIFLLQLCQKYSTWYKLLIAVSYYG